MDLWVERTCRYSGTQGQGGARGWRLGREGVAWSSWWGQSCGAEPLTSGPALTPRRVRIELQDTQLLWERCRIGCWKKSKTEGLAEGGVAHKARPCCGGVGRGG